MSVGEELLERGFVVMAGPVGPAGMVGVAAAYDAAMLEGRGPEFREGSTTDRLGGLGEVEEFRCVLGYGPLLEACGVVLDGGFRLSSMLGRTVRAGVGAQDLHVDLARGSAEGPMVGFIWMVDAFEEGNGATRFVPGSHRWDKVPGEVMLDMKAGYEGEVLALGEAGTLIVFDGSVWHGHTANGTGMGRRSVQGYFVRG